MQKYQRKNYAFSTPNCCLLLLVFLSSFQQDTRAEDAIPVVDVQVVGETAIDQTSKDVMQALHKLLSGVEKRDFDQVADCLSPDVIMIEKNNELIYGKQSVLDRAKNNILGGQKPG